MNDTILESMKKIDSNGKRFVIVVEKEQLLGILTDGDIRRYILKSGSLDHSVCEIMNKEPIVLSESYNQEEATKIFEKEYITAIPVVNTEGIVKNILFRDDILGSRVHLNEMIDIPIVIMAGGKGTRLYPYTKIIPKPLIPIGNKSIIELIIERFERVGCSDFTLLLNYKSDMIKSYLTEVQGERSLNYIKEETPLGTAGGLSLLKGIINETFILSNCDILIEGNYKDMVTYHKQKNNLITIISSLKNYTLPYGVINLDSDERLKEIREKPEMSFLINTGVYILEKRVVEEMKNDIFMNMTDIIEQYSRDGENVGVYPISEQSWMDMGNVEELEKMRRRFELDE